MTIRDMKVFLTVCNSQSMSAAAAKLSISQSAVSQAIRAIERHFDTKLFQRVGNKVYLTDSGRNMATCSAHIISYLSHTEAIMRGTQTRELLHVGSFGPFLLVDLVHSYEAVPHSPEVVLHVYSPGELLSKLSTGVLDIVITDSKPSMPGITSHNVWSNDAVFICNAHSKLHPALQEEHPAIQLKDFETIPILLRDEGNHSHIQFEELMIANQVNFFCKGLFTNYEGIYASVDFDLGVGLINDRVAPSHASRYKIVSVEGANIRHEIYVSYLSNRENNPLIREFVAHAKEHLPQLYSQLPPI